MEWLYPYVRLEDFMFVVKQLEEENKNLRDYADNLDSENDNQVIEIEELKKENKKLKSDLAFERTMLDNIRAEYESLQNVNKKLREELSRIKEKYGDLDY